MVRLLTVRALIVTLKRAIAISDQLKPRAWVCLAIIQAVVAALTFWAYQHARGEQRSHQSIMVQESNHNLKHVIEIPTRRTASHDLDLIELNVDSRIGPELLAFSRTAIPSHRGVAEPSDVTEATAEATADKVDPLLIYAIVVFESTPAAKPISLVESLDNARFYQARFAHQDGLSQPRYFDSSLTWRDFGDWSSFPSIPRFGPNAIMQIPAPEGESILGTVQKLVLLFQAVVLTIGSGFASVFGWIAYRRGKVELKLKELQIREMELRIEQMERDRMRAVNEATRSGIILLN